MTVRLKNTAEDRTKVHLHRTAPRLIQEPTLAGRRIRLGETITISDESYAQNKKFIDEWVAHGVIEVLDKVALFDSAGLQLDGPTLEEWIKAGYKPENYPPPGYSEKPSPALTAFRAGQAGAEVIKDAINLPSVTSQVLPLVEEPSKPIERSPVELQNFNAELQAAVAPASGEEGLETVPTVAAQAPVYTASEPEFVGVFPTRVELPTPDQIDDTPPASEPVPVAPAQTPTSSAPTTLGKGKKKLF